MQIRRGLAATPTVGAAHRSLFQLVVGASRQRAAPRSQFTNAASVAPSHIIGYRRPRHNSTTMPPVISLRKQRARANASANTAAISNSGALAGLRPMAFLGGAQSLRPNNSLNRTHCGVPSFGLENPSPNASTPQWAG